jgi:hypothetical protein
MSTQSLLLITIGPVQEFIAAARRSRDLWFGSWLLSELSKAAAINSCTGPIVISSSDWVLIGAQAPRRGNLCRAYQSLRAGNYVRTAEIFRSLHVHRGGRAA